MKILFFKLAWRNIRRNAFYSLINIIGFSIGIATILFIFLFVRFETGFDRFHPDGNRLFRVVETWNMKGERTVSGFSYFPEAPEITKSIPGVEGFCRVSDALEKKLFVGEQMFNIDRLRFADDQFFQFFNFKLIEGDPVNALGSADRIVLSQDMAKRIFGENNPIGKVLVYDQKLLTVTGIAENLPGNTHLKFDAAVSIKYVEQDRNKYYLGWGGGMQFLSYIKLMPGVSPGQIEAGIPAMLDRVLNKSIESSGFKLSANLQNIKDVHLSTGENRYDCQDNRSKSSILIVAAIGLIILLLALVNYISLYVAQKRVKIKSISLLSIHGAGRRQLMTQAFIEVVMISTIASLIGLLLLSLVNPVLDTWLNTQVTIQGNLIPILLFLVILVLVLSLIVTFLSTYGIFRERIVNTINESYSPGNRNNVFGSLLVAFQFTIVIILIISGLFIGRQNNFVMNKELGFDKENVLTLSAEKDFQWDELQAFRQELLKLPETRNVSLTSEGVGTGLTMNGYSIGQETESTMLNVIYTDDSFIDCFGISLLSGRNFREVLSQDKYSILINEKLVKRAGWKDPIDQTIRRNDPLTVIGTVKDFNFGSLYNEIQPMLIMCNPAYDRMGYQCVNIRYQTGDILPLVKKIRQIWERDYPGIPYEISFLDVRLASNYASLITQQKIVLFFSIMAILIACMGLLGLTALVARRRTREIGVRRVNGASVAEILVMLNRDFLKWVLFALAVAAPLSWILVNRWLQSFAYRTPLNWWVFALAGIVVILISLLTVSYQSFKAATRNPAESLRNE